MASVPGWERQTIPMGPHGWIQWKGTNVCMDIHCVCGESHHVDDEFVYYVRCSACGRSYMVNGHVELVELTPEEASQEILSMHILGTNPRDDDDDED